MDNARSVVVNELLVKSQARNRVRLKSSLFLNEQNNEKILSFFEDDNCSK